MARMVWADQTLSGDSDLTPLEPNLATLGVASLSDKHTLAKNELARTLRQRLSEYKGEKDPVETGADGSTVAAGTTFTAAGAAFVLKKVSTSARLWITSGDDKGVYTFTGKTATTITGVSPAFAATGSGLSYYIEADVLDLIKNPTVMTPAAVFLALYYVALELMQAAGDYWDMRREMYRKRFEQTYEELAPDLLIDLNQDQVISQSERAAGITGGRMIR